MSSEPENWQAWFDAAKQPGVADRLCSMLNEIDRAVSTSGFTCQQSGRCCKFDTFGHRLYMSGLEVAYFKSLAGEPSSHDTSLPIVGQDGCPYQADGLCSVHPHRPFACRVFFCQQGSDDWQSEQYEAFQAKIKSMHDELDLPYQYMEWRTGLTAALTYHPNPV